MSAEPDLFRDSDGEPLVPASIHPTAEAAAHRILQSETPEPSDAGVALLAEALELGPEWFWHQADDECSGCAPDWPEQLTDWTCPDGTGASRGRFWSIAHGGYALVEEAAAMEDDVEVGA